MDSIDNKEKAGNSRNLFWQRHFERESNAANVQEAGDAKATSGVSAAAGNGKEEQIMGGASPAPGITVASGKLVEEDTSAFISRTLEQPSNRADTSTVSPPPPPPLSRSSGTNRQPQTPGAFAYSWNTHGNARLSEHDNSEIADQDNAGIQPSVVDDVNGLDATADNMSNLAVAIQVDNPGDALDLPLAEEVTENTKEETLQERTRKQNIFVFMLCMIVIIVTITVLVVLLGRNDSRGVSTQVAPPSNTTFLALPIDDRLEALLPEYTLHPALNDPESPQARAYDWVVRDPKMAVVENEDYYVYSDERLLQRFALATFYFATNGPQWGRSDKWLDYSIHECEWYSHGSFDGFQDLIEYVSVQHNSSCEEKGTGGYSDGGIYKHIWMMDNALNGELPREFYWLSNLRSIMLDNNRVTGKIRADISRLTNLEVISSCATHLEGMLPMEELANMANLTGLMICYNPALEGTVRLVFATLCHLHGL